MTDSIAPLDKVEITKAAPSDEIAKKVLAEWFKAARPKWKLPADICVGTFFLVTTVFFMIQDPVPTFTWVAMAGAIVSFLVAFGYVPLLVTSALKANKRMPSYYKEKTYQFFPDHMIFSVEGSQGVEIPLEKFSQIRLTREAVLFLIGDKLALWFALDDLSKPELGTILSFLKDSGVRIVRTA